MKIFDAKHLGKPIAEEAKQRSLRDETQFMGFFSKAALEEMLRPAACVGIRFYNAGGLAPEECKLIGVGVADDGSELNQTRGRGYFLSAARAARGSDKKITKAQARALMLQLVRDRTPEAKRPIRFTSYFSRTMMEQLLAPKGGVSVGGIRLYSLTLEGTIFRTHVGVSSDGSTALRGSSPTDMPSHIVSDQPCPGGVCAVVAPPPGVQPASRSADAASLDEVAELDGNKYLLIWEKE